MAGYICRVCEKPCKILAVSGVNATLGNASECCENHFDDEASLNSGRPCAIDCCLDLDPKDKEDWGYKGE